ncbi:MAG: SLBB domain-containing protein [bacterium]
MKRFTLVLFMLHVLIVPAARAQNITPAHIDQMKRLSPAQQKALAEQYGVKIPEQGEDREKEEALVPVVIPRISEEPSAIEEKFHTRGEEDLAGPAVRSRRRIERHREDRGALRREPGDDQREQALPDASATRVDSPSEQRPAVKSERDLIRLTLEDLVEEGVSSGVSTEIDQFGYSLFAGTPTTFAPATDIPVPRDYIIGPEDEVLVHLYGARQEQLILTVTRKGTINFPDEGPIHVAGLTFSRMTSLIEEIVKNKMIGVNVYITMGQLRSIRVFVLGDVERPGSYTVSGLSTLSHALFVSGGVKKIGTLRAIELRRDGKRISVLDLYDFLLKGDTSGDVRLLPGDVVFVPPVGNTAGIAGEVKRPAIYELKGKTTVGGLIDMAGGLLATGFKNMAQIERINEDGERVVFDIDLSDDGKATTVRDGDLLKIFPVLDIEERVVYLSGNVKRPGKKGYVPGMRIADLVKGNDDLLPETYYSYALIEREAEGNREPELIRFDLGRVIEGDREANLVLQPRDRVCIFHRSHFREIPMVSIGGVRDSPGSLCGAEPKRGISSGERRGVALSPGPYACVSDTGTVVHAPGFYELKKGMRVIDLILAGGGLLRDAYLDEAELYRTDPLTKQVTVVKIDLRAVLGREGSDNLPLQDLDHLAVHSIWEFKTPHEVTVSGEVNVPGTYPLVEGATVSDLVFSGGSFTEKAYRKRAELTRYFVVKGEKRISEHIEVNLEGIASGDRFADIVLQPYDHLHIRRVTNWREAERVTVTGEVRFPGVYPIEEGEMLADLVERAGGFTDDAYLFAAKFTRRAIAEFQEKEFEDMADNLESDIARLGASPVAAGEEKDTEKRKFAVANLMQLVERLRTTKPEGRLIIHLMEPDQLRESRYNVLLQDGDALHIPKKPDSVLVLGEVYNPTAFLYEKGKNSRDFIRSAGGLTEMANRDAIYVIKANGEVVPDKTGFFRSGVSVGPGDIIVAPEKIRRVSGLELTKDISQIVYQLGISAAAFKTVGLFD